MLMINTENSFFDIFLYFLQVLPPPPPPKKNAFGDENNSFFTFGTFLTLCQIKILTNLVQNVNVKEYCYRIETNTKISFFTYLLERPLF